jgi:actin-like ATPase involved in cell morphogenesis
MDKNPQINNLEEKMDEILALAREFKIKQSCVDDLVKDINYVGNSALFSLQEELELENVKVDGRDLKEMLVLFMKNIKNLNTTLRQMDALTDFWQETGRVMSSLIMDFTAHAAILEQKGYMKLSRQAMEILDKFIQNIPEDTMQKLEEAAPELARMTSELAEPGLISQGCSLLKKRNMLIPALAAAWLIPVALLVANLFV